MNQSIRAELPSGDCINGELVEGKWILDYQGCSFFVEKVNQVKKNNLNPQKWDLPRDSDHASLLIREFILKAKGEWINPYSHLELCHCRQVSRQWVDACIVLGADSTNEVAERTRAGTGCGTCRIHIEALINLRKPKPPVCS